MLLSESSWRPSSRGAIWLSLLILGPVATLSRGGPDSASLPTTAPEAASPEALVARLGDPRYAVREDAQRRLADMGETALPALLARLDDPDPEISRRVTDLLPVPRDSRQRAELAVRLLRTGQREHLRGAVWLLFLDPGAVREEFRRAVPQGDDFLSAVSAPILEQLDEWQSQDERFRQTATRNAERNPEGVARLSRIHEETPPYLAELAYWTALEARDEYFTRRAASRPADERRGDRGPSTAPKQR